VIRIPTQACCIELLFLQTVAENVKKNSIEVPSGERRSCSFPQAQNIERIFATTWFILNN
jgi:hypothetical protein